jgi:hypothetical protein
MPIKRLTAGLTLIATLFLVGCGGGDGFVPTDPNTEFQLFRPGDFTEGSSSSVNLTGSDTAGGVFTGVFSTQTLAQTTFLGQPAIPSLGQVQLTNTVTGAFASNIGTSYISTPAADRRYLGYSDAGTTTVAATTSAIPETARIGDFGLVGTYTDNVGDVSIKSWRLDDGGGGYAILVTLSTTEDQFGALTISSIESTVIDSSGNPISYEIEIFYADLGITLTLNGS